MPSVEDDPTATITRRLCEWIASDVLGSFTLKRVISAGAAQFDTADDDSVQKRIRSRSVAAQAIVCFALIIQ
jgi:hypothetical protein